MKAIANKTTGSRERRLERKLKRLRLVKSMGFNPWFNARARWFEGVRLLNPTRPGVWFAFGLSMTKYLMPELSCRLMIMTTLDAPHKQHGSPAALVTGF
jgi:hypothetical protein